VLCFRLYFDTTAPTATATAARPTKVPADACDESRSVRFFRPDGERVILYARILFCSVRREQPSKRAASSMLPPARLSAAAIVSRSSATGEVYHAGGRGR
jgi:hypothetical protein